MKKGIIGGLIALVVLAVGGYFALTGVADALRSVLRDLNGS